MVDISELLVDGAAVERVAGGMVWAEGPAWIGQRQALRCSDIPNNRIMEYAEPDGSWTVYAEDVEFANGRTVGLSGEVVQCSHGRRRVEVDRDGEVTSLVDSFRGGRLNSPNDVVVKSDGTVWFSDPSYGIHREVEGHPGEEEYGDHVVFRLDPATGELTPVVIDVLVPNGLAFSPDESVLYVADSSRAPTRLEDPPGLGHAIHAYDVVDGRRCKNGRTFAEVDPGLPDGVRVDERGDVWTSSDTGVAVFAPDGSAVGRVEVGEVVSNVCFGGADGRTLYITASTSLYRIRTRVRDAAAVLRAGRG